MWRENNFKFNLEQSFRYLYICIMEQSFQNNKLYKMGKLLNKVAVITGGNSGIGFATAKEFIAEGAKVIITGRSQTAINEAVKQLGENATGIVAEASSLQATETLVDKVKAQFGLIDILFINAGIAVLAPFESITEQQFDQTMDINFKGAFFTLQKFLPLLKAGSAVTFLSSVNAHASMPNTAVYGASKAAMNAVMKIAAYELAPKSIRVNAVSPGPIETALVAKTGLSQEQLNGFGTAMKQRIPLHKFGTGENVAKLVVFLSSDDATYITGSEYVIDGGVLLNPILR